jgi:hypothetical protein
MESEAKGCAWMIVAVGVAIFLIISGFALVGYVSTLMPK